MPSSSTKQSPQLPPHFLTRPGPPPDDDTVASFERLYAEAVEHGMGAAIDYSLSAPKWQFLCYLCDTKEVLMHGSGKDDIDEFEPRQSNDIDDFGNRQAVYAASDGIWPMYFAVMDRDRYVKSLMNACFRVVNDDGTEGKAYYFFSINGDALPHKPWRNGTIYILPRTTFEQQEHRKEGGMDLVIAQWASLVPVMPLAKLAVEPGDFPFLSQIQSHDPARIQEQARLNPAGFPWLEEQSDHLS